MNTIIYARVAFSPVMGSAIHASRPVGVLQFRMSCILSSSAVDIAEVEIACAASKEGCRLSPLS